MRRATQGSLPFQGSRPDNCRPVEGPPLARAQVLGVATREPAARGASRPRHRVHLMLQQLPTTKQQAHCGVADTA
jgi:hypothetical protein